MSRAGFVVASLSTPALSTVELKLDSESSMRSKVFSLGGFTVSGAFCYSVASTFIELEEL